MWTEKNECFQGEISVFKFPRVDGETKLVSTPALILRDIQNGSFPNERDNTIMGQNKTYIIKGKPISMGHPFQ